MPSPENASANATRLAFADDPAGRPTERLRASQTRCVQADPSIAMTREERKRPCITVSRTAVHAAVNRAAVRRCANCRLRARRSRAFKSTRKTVSASAHQDYCGSTNREVATMPCARAFDAKFLLGKDAARPRSDWITVALLHHPKVGDVLMCRFPECLRAPEMIKTRPVIVVTREHKGRRRLCTVVPVSTTQPDPMLSHHVELEESALPRALRGTGHWVKCDMIYTLCIDRLDRIRSGKDRTTGKRLYETARIGADDMRKIRYAIRSALSLEP